MGYSALTCTLLWRGSAAAPGASVSPQTPPSLSAAHWPDCPASSEHSQSGTRPRHAHNNIITHSPILTSILRLYSLVPRPFSLHVFAYQKGAWVRGHTLSYLGQFLLHQLHLSLKHLNTTTPLTCAGASPLLQLQRDASNSKRLTVELNHRY